MAYSIAAGPTVETHTTATSLAIDGVTAAVGTVVIVGMVADNGHTSGTSSFDNIVDSANNSWTVDTTVNRTAAGAPNDGTTLRVAHAVITNALVAGTITIGYLESIVSKSAVTWIVTPNGRKLESYGVAMTDSNFSQTPSSGAISVSLTDTIMAFLGDQRAASPAGDADTTNGAWSTRTFANAGTGVQATSESLMSQYKTPTAAGNQTWDADLGLAIQWALAVILFGYRVEAALAVTSGTDTAALTARAVYDGALGAAETMDILSAAAHAVDDLILAATDPTDGAYFTDSMVAALLDAHEPVDFAAFSISEVIHDSHASWLDPMRRRVAHAIEQHADGVVLLRRSGRSFELNAVVRGAAAEFIDGTQILATDLMLVVEPVSPPPTITDLIYLDGKRQVVKRILPVPAAGTPAMFKIFVAS